MLPHSQELTSIMYMSEKDDKFFPEAIHLMLLEARKHNNRKQITGCLFYYKGYFLQYIEGGEADIRNLYGRIAKDSRHKRVENFYDQPLSSRLFHRFMMDFHELEGDPGMLAARFEILKQFLHKADVDPANRANFRKLLHATQYLLDSDRDPISNLHHFENGVTDREILIEDLELEKAS